MSVFENVPSDLCELFTDHERALVDQYHAATQQLLSGDIAPKNDQQERLLRVISGKQNPSSGFEMAWVRFNAWNKAVEVRKQLEKRISELESELGKARERAVSAEANLQRKYRRVSGEVSAPKTYRDAMDLAAYFKGLYESTYDDLHPITLREEVKERVICDVTAYPVQLGYEPMPVTESNSIDWQCQACGRSLDFCQCAN